jgi:hypothetical protein
LSAVITNVPDYAVWAVLLVFVSAGLTHLVRVRREKFNAARREAEETRIAKEKALTVRANRPSLVPPTLEDVMKFDPKIVKIARDLKTQSGSSLDTPSTRPSRAMGIIVLAGMLIYLLVELFIRFF